MLLKSMENFITAQLDDEISLFTSKPYFLEILPPGTNKGTALAKIAEILGVSPEECMAIGDSMNDEAMIRWAGLGVAMVNGDEKIKSIAGLVTDHTNDDDGVAEIIEAYILGKE